MRFYWEEAQVWRSRKQEVLSEINRSGLPLILFGKAPVVDEGFLQGIHVPMQFICDNNPEKWGTWLWGMEVIAPACIHEKYDRYNVLILVPFEHQIIPQLQNLTVPPVQIFRLDLYFEEDDTAGYFREVREEAAAIYHCLADQASKDTYEAVMRYRINRDPAHLRRIMLPRETQYFPGDLGGRPLLGPAEVFADAGAFTGDTVRAFCAAVQGKYDKIYAFEPEQKNYQKLLETAQNVRNISCCQTAVGDKKGQIRFFSDDSGSKADASGGEVVPVDTLDHLLGEERVTYIKMDVEGMECAALRGAQELIRRNHPKLAVCTYHSNADMVRVPALILQLDPSYRLYFRHYSPALVETVCYAL